MGLVEVTVPQRTYKVTFVTGTKKTTKEMKSQDPNHLRMNIIPNLNTKTYAEIRTKTGKEIGTLKKYVNPTSGTPYYTFRSHDTTYFVKSVDGRLVKPAKAFRNDEDLKGYIFNVIVSKGWLIHPLSIHLMPMNTPGRKIKWARFGNGKELLNLEITGFDKNTPRTMVKASIETLLSNLEDGTSRMPKTYAEFNKKKPIHGPYRIAQMPQPDKGTAKKTARRKTRK